MLPLTFAGARAQDTPHNRKAQQHLLDCEKSRHSGHQEKILKCLFLKGEKANTTIYFFPPQKAISTCNTIPLQVFKTKNAERGKEEVYAPINNITQNSYGKQNS